LPLVSFVPRRLFILSFSPPASPSLCFPSLTRLAGTQLQLQRLKCMLTFSLTGRRGMSWARREPERGRRAEGREQQGKRGEAKRRARCEKVQAAQPQARMPASLAPATRRS
jgi:hypothetical protein